MTLLSSRWTPLFKFVLPALFGTGFGYVTALMFLDPGRVRTKGGGAPAPWDKWLFLGFLIAGCFVCARAAALKRVEFDDRSLRISNFWRSIQIPLGQIRSGGFEDAEASIGLAIGPVALSERRSFVRLIFERDTPFGRFVEFVPRSKEALDRLRARLGWEDPVPPADSEASELAEELRGRGTV